MDGDPSTYWAAADGVTTAAIEVDLGHPRTFNRSMLQEYIPLGQRVEEYILEAWDGKVWKEFMRGTTIGYKKLDRFSDVTASRVRVTIVKSRGYPTVREFGLYEAPVIAQ